MLTEVTPLRTITPVLPKPLVRELSADLETPTTVYLKLSGAGPSFCSGYDRGGSPYTTPPDGRWTAGG